MFLFSCAAVRSYDEAFLSGETSRTKFGKVMLCNTKGVESLFIPKSEFARRIQSASAGYDCAWRSGSDPK